MDVIKVLNRTATNDDTWLRSQKRTGGDFVGGGAEYVNGKIFQPQESDSQGQQGGKGAVENDEEGSGSKAFSTFARGIGIIQHMKQLRKFLRSLKKLL